MRVVCDAHIPFIKEAIQKEWPDIDICPLKPEEIDAFSARDADVLIVRTRTKVNEALLAGSSVRLVCTATIGFDHIDTAYCDTHGIRWTSCPGCNAQAVCDYIEEAIKKGASKIICEHGDYPVETEIVKDTRKYLEDYLYNMYNLNFLNLQKK